MQAPARLPRCAQERIVTFIDLLRLGFEKARLANCGLLHCEQGRQSARRFKEDRIGLSTLCQLNGLSRNADLKPGQRIKLTQANLPVSPSFGSASCPVKDLGKKPAAVKPDKKSSKPSEAKARSTTSKPSAKVNSKSAIKGKDSAKHAAAAKGKVKPAASAKTAAKKPALKQTGKSGKRTTLAKK